MTGASTPAGLWLARFAAALNDPERVDWSALFADDCYWRDLVAFSWNIVTVEGIAGVAAMAKAQGASIAARKFVLDDPALPMTDERQAWFTFETATSRGRGHVELELGESGPRATMLLTAATELIGFEEPAGARRQDGIAHQARRGRRFWIDDHDEEARALGREVQPYCLIVGGGQNGLQLAARLRRLRVPTLVVDASANPGDCWRGRYRSLHLHDAIYMNHFPYLPFPDHWPLYMPKDRMGDWLEAYASVMDIALWNRTHCTGARYDEATGEWEVTVERDGQRTLLRPRQLVLATGLSGAKNIPRIAGTDRFKGRQYHSADHPGGEDMTGTRCVVIGSNNSAHDIAVDMWESGAEVTMLQRSPTIVVRAETRRHFAGAIPHSNPDIPSEFGDLMLATLPLRRRITSDREMTDRLREIDEDFYARLEDSGFQLSHGEDGTGSIMAYLRRGAGYYIDVGGSDLIANGDISLAHGEIAEIAEDGVRMASGTFLPADVIVYATGYRPLNEFVAQLITLDVATKIGPCWGFGSGTRGDPGPWEGELRNMWKPTAQEGLWFQAGNLMQARFHSLHLALQIKAREQGLETPVYSPAMR